ncbi:MAG: hypothetical protein ABSD71_00235 [Bacteroidales bacterium]|jgi:hypothetical protein
MLNERQREIADYLLKYIEKKGGKSSLDDYPSEMNNKGYEEFEWSYIKEFLREQVGLLYYLGNSEYTIALTPEGYNAAKVGIVKYFQSIEEDKQLQRDSMINNIEGIHSSKKLSKIAIVVAIVVPAFSIGINLWIQMKPDHKGFINDNNISTTKQDSVLVEKIRFKLKNDPKFLNDLKDLINRK